MPDCVSAGPLQQIGATVRLVTGDKAFGQRLDLAERIGVVIVQGGEAS